LTQADAQVQIRLIDRPPDAFQQPVVLEQLLTLIDRAFGPDCVTTSIQELAGGSINNAYRISFADRPEVVLRIAPRADHPQSFRHEGRLLRREYYAQPFLAPIANLVPSVLMADFTHQIVERDYFFQPYIKGDIWGSVHNGLSTVEQKALWQQLGRITRAVHEVTGEAFGAPDPIPQFQRWSHMIVADFDGIVRDMEIWGVATTEIRTVADYAADHSEILDAVATPHLLHGDLWLNNLLIQRTASGVVIAGVIDAGFAMWADPASDWTIARMTISPMVGSEPFWETYGALENGTDAQIRGLIYQVRSIGISLLELRRMKHANFNWLWSILQETVQTLQTRSQI
jgi:aminoglycoside phosphotransferase (APT) family kinase protein